MRAEDYALSQMAGAFVVPTLPSPKRTLHAKSEHALRGAGQEPRRRIARFAGVEMEDPREVTMQATVQISPDGSVIANLDTDDFPEDDDERALLNLRADDMLDQCSRVAIAAWFEIRERVAEVEDE